MTQAPDTYDAVIIGGGHNGLVCSYYLARAGLRVVVLERLDGVGGMVRNVTLPGGIPSPACGRLVSGLNPTVISDMALERHGLQFVNSDVRTLALSRDGDPLEFALTDDTADSLRRHSENDAVIWPEFRQRMLKFAGVIASLAERRPPLLAGGDRKDRTDLWRLAWRLRGLGREEMREFLRVGGMNIHDLLDDYFESDLLKGAIAADAVMGSGMGPRSPGTVFTWLHRLSGQVDRQQAAVALVAGTPHTLADAMHSAVVEAGVEVRLRSHVARVLVESDNAVGVELSDGGVLRAPIVVSNSDPRTTYLGLLGPAHLDTGFVRRVRQVRQRGVTARLDLVVDGVPEIKGVGEDQLNCRMFIAPSAEFVEEAFNASKYGECSAEPVVELIVPTFSDFSLASPGTHLISATLQYLPVDAPLWNEKFRSELVQRYIQNLAGFIPSLPGMIVEQNLITAQEIERDYGVAGGHWHHAELALDQAWFLRPVPGSAQYASPVRGFYLCGAGTHPGGGVTGNPGRNAAQQILGSERLR